MTKGRGIVAYLFSVFLFLGLYFSMLQRIVGEIAKTYQLDNTLMGTIIMMTFVGYFIGPIIMGEIADRFGRKTLMLGAFIFMLAGFVIVLTVSSAVGIGAGLLVIGIAFGVFELAMSSLLTDLRPDDANRVMNNSRLFFALGTISGPFVALGVLNWLHNWVYVMAGAIVLLAILFVIFLVLSYPKPKYPNLVIDEKPKTSLTLTLLKKGAVIALCVSMMMYVAVESGLTFYMSSYMTQIGSTEIITSLTLSLFWLFVAAGRFVAGRFRHSLGMLIITISAIGCAGLVIGMLTSDVTLSMIAFAIMGMGCSGIFPTLLGEGKNRFPKYAGTVFGIMLSSAAIGGIVFPLIMGTVADASNLKTALGLCFIPFGVIILMQVLLLASARRQKKAAGIQADSAK